MMTAVKKTLGDKVEKMTGEILKGIERDMDVIKEDFKEDYKALEESSNATNSIEYDQIGEGPDIQKSIAADPQSKSP